MHAVMAQAACLSVIFTQLMALFYLMICLTAVFASRLVTGTPTNAQNVSINVNRTFLSRLDLDVIVCPRGASMPRLRGLPHCRSAVVLQCWCDAKY